MDALLLMSVVIVVATVVAVLGFARMAWRVRRRNEQLEAGGSWSRQALGRSADGGADSDESA